MTVESDLISFYRTSNVYQDRIYSERKKLKEGRVRLLLERIDTDDNYLDVGCGPGVLANFVCRQKGAKTTGVDISPYAVSLAKKARTKAKFLVTSAEKLPFQDNSFELVSCFEVLEHLPRPERCLREMIRCCRKGGILVISLPHWFIGVGKRKGWFINLCLLPLFMVAFYFRSLFTTNLVVFRLKPYLKMEDWRGKKISEMADRDACSWIFSRSLAIFLKQEGMEVVYFNSYQFLEDNLDLLASSWSKRAGLFLMKVAKKLPAINSFGSGMYIIAKKNG